MLKTYHGSCHCGAVRFEADIDLSAGTGKCNCSICMKRRKWGVNIKPEQFRLCAGADALTDYQFGNKFGHHYFCSTCGAAPFGDGYVEEIGGDFISISINCLDDASDEELAAVPVAFFNGRDNAWWDKPDVTGHL
ncbi:GFA family protein [Sphingomonas sp. DT-204]|uniref:GFA family protein n=1 Tax=Sphingomonas sp. DT-204 TaxID=3396166 RepID=UPI003F196349